MFTANQHLEAVNPNLLYILLVTIIMKQKRAANYDDLLLKNHQSEVSDKKNSPISNSHITKIEDYINKKPDQIALEHLKSKIVKEIKHEFTNNNNSNDLNDKVSPKDVSDKITELRAHIQTLESEVYFLREELIEKSFLLRSLITSKQNANNCSTLPTTPEKLLHRVQLLKIDRQSGQNQANTRSSVLKVKHPLRNTCSGQKNVSYLTPIVWNSLPTDLKLANSLNNFKHKLKDDFFKKLRNMEQDIFDY